MSQPKMEKGTLTTLLNADKDQNKENSTLYDVEKLGNTPFALIKQENKYFLVLGNNRVTEKYETREEAIEQLEVSKWDLILHLAIVVTERILETREQEKEVLEKLKQAITAKA